MLATHSLGGYIIKSALVKLSARSAAYRRLARAIAVTNGYVTLGDAPIGKY